jgi:hypothetical protein
MKNESTTFGLEPEQLARLLNIGSTSPWWRQNTGANQKKSEQLYFQLSKVLLPERCQKEMLPKVLKHFHMVTGLLGCETIGNLLLNPMTEMYLVRNIKKYGKKLSLKAKTEVDHDVGATIYYAAIANALVFHHQRITRFSYQRLCHSYLMMSKKIWICGELLRLFEKARKYCELKIAKKERL